MSCGEVHRCSSDLALLWLWYRQVATALIGPLAWEPPYAMVAAVKRQKKKREHRGRRGRNTDSRVVPTQGALSNAEGIIQQMGSFLILILVPVRGQK